MFLFATLWYSQNNIKKSCKIVCRALQEMPPVQFSPVQPAGSSCYALRLLNSDFCESSQGNNLLHVGRKEPHVSKISWHHALGSTLFSNSEILKDLAMYILLQRIKIIEYKSLHN